MISHLSIQDILAVGAVDRWHNTATARRQSLAEHSYQVAMLAAKLAHAEEDLGKPLDAFEWSQLFLCALTHDLHEVDFGDIPSPTKWLLQARIPALGRVDDHLEDEFWARRHATRPVYDLRILQLVRVADMLDACIFYFRAGLAEGRHGVADLRGELLMETRKVVARETPELRPAVFRILQEAKVLGPLDHEFMGSVA